VILAVGIVRPGLRVGVKAVLMPAAVASAGDDSEESVYCAGVGGVRGLGTLGGLLVVRWVGGGFGVWIRCCGGFCGIGSGWEWI